MSPSQVFAIFCIVGNAAQIWGGYKKNVKLVGFAAIFFLLGEVWLLWKG